MEAMSVMPRQSYDWTVDDLELLPDDGLQYELLDGLLLVTPAPIPDHQRFARGIFLVRHEACPAGFEVFFALREGRYADVGTATGDDVLELDAPFVVRVQPSALIR